MGRYPFDCLIDPYLRDHAGVMNPKTREARRRGLKQLGKLIVGLKEEGAIRTTNPTKFSKNDALAIVGTLASNPWKPLYLCAVITHLRTFVSYCGNPVFDELARLKLLPKAPAPALKSLSETELAGIKEGVEDMDGWRGEVARFIAAIYPACGARASELRMAKITDLNTDNWTIHLTNVKGKNRYARERTAPILPEAREATLRFLRARDSRLKSIGLTDAEPLIPCIQGTKANYYTASGFTHIKLAMAKVSKVQFKIKDYRATFAQRCIDLDPTLLTPVSKALGHKSSTTTETYYCRIGDAPAIAQIQSAWERKVVMQAPKPQFPLIERKEWTPGYA